jgi:hypothetical protein
MINQEPQPRIVLTLAVPADIHKKVKYICKNSKETINMSDLFCQFINTLEDPIIVQSNQSLGQLKRRAKMK